MTENSTLTTTLSYNEDVTTLAPGPLHHFAEYGVFLIGLVGFLGNGFVLFCFLRNRNLRRRLRNMLVIHQSLVDFTTSVLFWFCYGSKSLPKEFQGVSGKIICTLLDSEAPMWLFLCVSTANLVLITFERYFMTVHPVFYQTKINKCWVLSSIIAAWFLTICLQGILLFYSSGVIDGKCHVVGLLPNKQLEQSFCVAYLILNFFIPVGVFIGCYGKMLLVTRKRERALVICHLTHDLSGENEADIRVNHRRTLRMTKTQSNLTRTMFIVSACFVACWVPSHVHYFLETFEIVPNLAFHGLLYRILTYIALSNVCVNPIIYAFKYADFKKEAKKVLPCCKKKPELGTGVTSNAFANSFS